MTNLMAGVAFRRQNMNHHEWQMSMGCGESLESYTSEIVLLIILRSVLRNYSPILHPLLEDLFLEAMF